MCFLLTRLFLQHRPCPDGMRGRAGADIDRRFDNATADTDRGDLCNGEHSSYRLGCVRVFRIHTTYPVPRSAILPSRLGFGWKSLLTYDDGEIVKRSIPPIPTSTSRVLVGKGAVGMEPESPAGCWS